MFADTYLEEYRLSIGPYPDANAEPYRIWFRIPIAIGPNVAGTHHHRERVIRNPLTRTVRITSAVSATPRKTKFGRVITARVVASPDSSRDRRVGLKARMAEPNHNAVTGTSVIGAISCK